MITPNDPYLVPKALLMVGSHTILYISVLSFFDPRADILSMGRCLNLLIGTLLSNVKYLYILYHRDSIHAIILHMDAKAVQIQERAKTDVAVRNICNRYYWQQRSFFCAILPTEVILVTLVFIDAMVKGELMFGDFELSTLSYCLLNVGQYLAAFFVDTNYLLLDQFIGGLYQETRKELALLHYDLQLLGRGGVTKDEKFQRLNGLAQNYQEIVSVQEQVTAIMSNFFAFYLGCVLLVMIFVCVELSILVNEDITKCIEPLYYFCFMNLAFFYWCWLGNSLLTMVMFIEGLGGPVS